MRKPLPAPGNGRRSNVKGDHLEASVRQLLGIITQSTPNHESELSFALSASAIQPPDEVGVDFHVGPVNGLLIFLSLHVQCLKPARGIPPLRKLLGELPRPCSCLLFHPMSPVFSLALLSDNNRSWEFPFFQRARLSARSGDERFHSLPLQKVTVVYGEQRVLWRSPHETL